jgi:aspartate kinase
MNIDANTSMNETEQRTTMMSSENVANGSEGSTDLRKPATGQESRTKASTASGSMGDIFPDLGPETPVISGVAHDRTESLVTLRGVPDRPGVAAQVFTELAKNGINIDMIVQAGASTGKVDVSFTMPDSMVKAAKKALDGKMSSIGYESYFVDMNVGKVAVVGVGMKTHSGLAAKFFEALSAQQINVIMISTSEIRIAALVSLDQLDDVVRALHTAYGLDADQVEAVVYGGTGR